LREPPQVAGELDGRHEPVRVAAEIRTSPAVGPSSSA
jgi:hypothetical protein